MQMHLIREGIIFIFGRKWVQLQELFDQIFIIQAAMHVLVTM